ncbi:MAG: diaminopimelate decarboxylase [Dehalococcoidia bacterium]|nr:MAG: diaminopimelate decarboxylase [Dehalococcoidia bacterium]
MLRLFPQTTQVEKNHLVIGGCDAGELASEFGTPLYIFDEATLRGKCAEYRKGFAQRYPNSLVIYACKAFINPALAQLFKEEGLGLDVVSAGELAIAKSVDFPMAQVYFNGNNKSRQELELAIGWGVRRIVVDNSYELSLLDEVAKEAGVRQGVILRLSPGVDPHTHAHLTTGATDSKFGFPMAQAEEALTALMSSSSFELIGVHFHIGSQIFDLSPYKQAIEIVLDFAAKMGSKHGFKLKELSTGGGLAITYTEDTPAPTIGEFAEAITATLLKKCEALGLEPPRLVMEPGRSIVGGAGVALYTVGAIKEIAGVRKYVSVDGGIADNIRPALYGAKYEAIVANKVADENLERVTVAGKFCQSGDILIQDIDLPKLEPGDIIAMPCCGAYCLSMASNYNASLKPPIVLVKDGKARLIRRRESYEDLMNCDII